jgi:hypothetical protein
VPIVIAELHAGVADADQAFSGPEKAYAEHALSMVDLNVDPMVDPVRSDPEIYRLTAARRIPDINANATKRWIIPMAVLLT